MTIDPHYCLNCASTGRADDGCGSWMYCTCLYGAELREMHTKARNNLPRYRMNLPLDMGDTAFRVHPSYIDCLRVSIWETVAKALRKISLEHPEEDIVAFRKKAFDPQNAHEIAYEFAFPANGTIVSFPGEYEWTVVDLNKIRNERGRYEKRIQEDAK